MGPLLGRRRGYGPHPGSFAPAGATKGDLRNPLWTPNLFALVEAGDFRVLKGVEIVESQDMGWLNCRLWKTLSTFLISTRFSVIRVSKIYTFPSPQISPQNHVFTGWISVQNMLHLKAPTIPRNHLSFFSTEQTPFFRIIIRNFNLPQQIHTPYYYYYYNINLLPPGWFHKQ